MRAGSELRLAAALGRTVDLDLSEVSAFDSNRLLVARHRRRWRVRWLRGARLVTVAAAVLVGAARWDELGHFAHRLFNQLIAWVTELPAVGSLLDGVLRDRVKPSHSLGVVVLIVIAATAHRVVVAAWNLWQRGETHELVTRGDYLPRSAERVAPSGQPPMSLWFFGRVLFNFAWMAMIGVATYVALDLTRWNWWVYLLLILAVWLVAAGLANVHGFAGGLRRSIPKLIRRVGVRDDEEITAFDEKVKAQQQVFIDRLGAGAETVWDAGLTLMGRGPRETNWDEVAKFKSLADAIEWGEQRTTRVFAASGDFKYRPAKELLGQEAMQAEDPD